MDVGVVYPLASAAFVGGVVGYLLGWRVGAANERSKLVVHVRPWDKSESSWLGFKNSVMVGYSQQIHYNGLPIGKPQVVVTHAEEAWDSSLRKKLLPKALKAAARVVMTLAANHVHAQMLELPSE